MIHYFRRALSFFPLILLFTACDADELVPNEPDQPLEVAMLEPLPLLHINDLRLEFREGVPAYRNTQEFDRALQVLSQTVESVYLEWAERENFRAEYHNYLAVVDKVERDTNSITEQLVTEDDLKHAALLPGGGWLSIRKTIMLE